MADDSTNDAAARILGTMWAELGRLCGADVSVARRVEFLLLCDSIHAYNETFLREAQRRQPLPEERLEDDQRRLAEQAPFIGSTVH